MVSVKQIDARIFEVETQMESLRRELEELRAARDSNTLHPLLRLPDELLVYIAQAAIPGHVRKGSPCDALYLTWICRRLRALFVAAPSLWRRIDLSAASRKGCARVLLDRASSYPLDVLSSGVQTGEDRTLLLECLPRVEGWTMDDVNTGSQTMLAAQLEAAGITCSMLRTITLRSYGTVPMKLATFPDLVTLNIDGMGYPGTLPNLPNLRTFRMKDSTCSLHHLYSFFAQAPSLELIDLGLALSGNKSDRWEDHEFSEASVPVSLPHLYQLIINEIPENAAHLLRILPVPSFSMHITFVTDMMDTSPIWPYIPGDAERNPIDRRMREFWSKLARASGRKLVGTAYYDGNGGDSRLRLRFEGVGGAYGACEGYAIRDEDRLWEDVQTLEVHSLGARGSEDGLPMFRFVVLRYLPKVEHVLIAGLRTASGFDSQHIAYLEKWLMQRGRAGLPLQNLVFRDCDEESRPLLTRLVEGRASRSAVWQ
jgi:hypothetical protein